MRVHKNIYNIPGLVIQKHTYMSISKISMVNFKKLAAWLPCFELYIKPIKYIEITKNSLLYERLD